MCQCRCFIYGGLYLDTATTLHKTNVVRQRIVYCIVTHQLQINIIHQPEHQDHQRTSALWYTENLASLQTETSTSTNNISFTLDKEQLIKHTKVPTALEVCTMTWNYGMCPSAKCQFIHLHARYFQRVLFNIHKK